MSINSGSLYYVLLLCKIIDIAQCPKIVFILLNLYLMAYLRI